MRRSQLLIALSIGAASGLVCVALVKGINRMPASKAVDHGSTPEAVQAEVAPVVTAREPAHVLASTGKATSPRAMPAAPPSAPKESALPASLDAVPTTPWREAQLARYSPQERVMLDYKLGLMARMRECAAAIDTQGKLNVFLHYETQPGTGVAKGSGVDPVDSSLDREADEAALDCVREAHVSAPMPLLEAGPEQSEFHWATEIIFPLEDDRAYQFFAR
ncbi:MAG TPA: hypothetical protein VI072_06920 [Polyangiaceae bacterium]